MNWFQSIFFKKIVTLYLFIVTKYVNFLIVIGIILCLITPFLIYFLTGINIYDPDTHSLLDPLAYSDYTVAEISRAGVRPFFFIRTCLATIFFNLIVLLILFNYTKLSGSWTNKALMGATCVIVHGGFEGLGDPDLDAQQETAKPRRMLNSSHSPIALEIERDSVSKLEKEVENQRANSKGKAKLIDVNPPGGAQAQPTAIPIPKSFMNSSKFIDFKYIMGLGNPNPWENNPFPTRETTNFPVGRGEGEFSNKTSHRQVRLNENVHEQILVIGGENLEKNKIYITSKSSESEAAPDLNSQGHGKINNPASNSDMISLLKNILKKFK